MARMKQLDAFMRPSPTAGNLYKVIAIDGADRHAIRGMIACLQHFITRDLRHFVRVVNEESFYPITSQPTQLSHFIRRVESWNAIWDMIHHSRLPSSNASLHYGMGGSGNHPGLPDHLGASLPYQTIYIVPLSPFMATMHALGQTVDSKDSWRLMCNYWNDSFRPDVTIIMGNIIDTQLQNEVLRFEVDGINALIVTREGDTDLTATPQMRRVVFEVEEWIRC